jgi:Uncharacterised protein family UPF0547
MDGIVVPVIWLVLSYTVMVYAGSKGRSRGGFFLLSLFLTPLVAFVLLAVGPSNPQRQGLLMCPQCAEWLKHEALRCRFCGFDFTAPAPLPLRPDARK